MSTMRSQAPWYQPWHRDDWWHYASAVVLGLAPVVVIGWLTW